jgi:hypothetical protein
MISRCLWRNTSVRATRSSARARSLSMSRVIGAAPYRMATTADVRLFRFLRPVLHQVACCSSSRRRSRSAMNSACIPSYSRSPASVLVVSCPKRRRVSVRLRCVWRNTSERAIRSSARARSLGRSRDIAITLPNRDDCGCRTSARLPVTPGAGRNGQKAAGADMTDEAQRPHLRRMVRSPVRVPRRPSQWGRSADA